MIRESVLDDLGQVAGIVFYSFYQSSTRQEQQWSVCSRVIKANKSLHFAVEGMSIAAENDIDAVEPCLLVKATSDYCSPEIRF